MLGICDLDRGLDLSRQSVEEKDGQMSRAVHGRPVATAGRTRSGASGSLELSARRHNGRGILRGCRMPRALTEQIFLQKHYFSFRNEVGKPDVRTRSALYRTFGMNKAAID